MNSNFMVLVLIIATQPLIAGEQKLFTLEKSFNSENIMVIHTQTDENCKFLPANGYIDFYWMMNGQTRKEVHPTIRSKVLERVNFLKINDQRDIFTVRMNDLSELNHDLESTTFEVKSEMNNGLCEAIALINLGVSAQYRQMKLQRSYCEVGKNLLGIPNSCKFLELQGIDAKNGEKLTVRFKKN